MSLEALRKGGLRLQGAIAQRQVLRHIAIPAPPRRRLSRAPIATSRSQSFVDQPVEGVVDTLDTRPMTTSPGDASANLGFDMTTMFMVAERMQRAHQEAAAAMAPFIDSLIEMKKQQDEWLDKFVEVALEAHRRLHEYLPANWPRNNLKNISAVLQEEGIPLAYVPRAETVRALLDAVDYESRMRVLANHRLSIVDDCRVAIGESALHPSVADLKSLINEAQAILATGYFAGAHCLAVNLCDTIVRRTMEPNSKYKKIVDTIEESGFEDELFSVALAFRPVPSFYKFYKFGVETPPVQLSRHRTAHEISPEHTSEHNSIVAVMLATSLALAVSDWRKWLDDTDEEEGLPEP